jgi:hypothetical protein
MPTSPVLIAQSKRLYTVLPMRATCAAYFIILGLLTLPILGDVTDGPVPQVPTFNTLL